MNNIGKILVFFVFILLILFLIFRNINTFTNAERSLPTDEELKKFNNVTTKSYANSYEVKDVPDKELATIYYNHFKDLVLNNPDEAYKRLKNKKEISRNLFDEFRNNLINNYYTSKVKKYKILNGIDVSTYEIVNTSGETITFYVDAVLKYEVELSL